MPKIPIPAPLGADKPAPRPYIALQRDRIFRKRARRARFFVSGTHVRLSPLEQRLHDLLAPAIAAAGFELVRLRVTGRTDLTLQIMAERPDKTMSAEDCALLSRTLSPILDEQDPIAGSYRLEVSSPGIDRPLTRLKDYDDWQGYEARIELNRVVEGRKRFKGVLAGVDGDNICLDVEGEEETALVPFAWIASGKLILTDELMRESLNAQRAQNLNGARHDKDESAEGDAA
ncbi:MAG: ribosome maturation factor RimP [Parvularculaceae bacterium]|nr:ribosome maturation factor RimP [Parvularculaceae bacterium]